MIIDGIASAEAPDSSGEIVSIKGMDVSSVEDGEVMLNWEHKSNSPEDCVGKVIFAKKIFSLDDCDNERERHYWEMVELPFLYIQARLFDDHKGSEAAKAIIRDCIKNKENINCRYSVEGSTLERDGNKLKETIVRAIALTLKPCFKGSVAEMLKDSNELSKAEGIVSSYSFDAEAITIDGPLEVLEKALEEFKDLNKTFTLGGASGAPDTLSGGAAVSKEEVGPNRDLTFIKSQVLAALRDWDGTRSFKTFLKHRLPDASESILDKFADMAEEIKLKKQSQEVVDLQKDEAPDEYAHFALAQLEDKVPKGAVAYKNQYVEPGEIQLISGPYQGQKLKLLHQDDNYVYVKPLKSGSDREVKVNKINRKLEGTHFLVDKKPKKLQLPVYVHGDKHADPALTDHHNQRELIHGIDLAGEPIAQTHPHGSTEARSKGNIGWYRSAHNKMGYIKPAVVFPHEHLNPKDEHYINTAKRETIFHNVAKNVFGLGDHVPTTATFKDPHSNHDHSIMEQVPFGEHFKLDQSEHKDKLIQAGDSGQLQKLAIMDTVMSNQDRNRTNYLISPNNPNVHLIDNSLIFNDHDDFMPAYLHDYHQVKGSKTNDAQLHPETNKWLLSLDPFKLGNELARQGVHGRLIQKAVGKLLSMQSSALLGNNNLNDVLFAHNKYGQEGK